MTKEQLITIPGLKAYYLRGSIVYGYIGDSNKSIPIAYKIDNNYFIEY